MVAIDDLGAADSFGGGDHVAPAAIDEFEIVDLVVKSAQVVHKAMGNLRHTYLWSVYLTDDDLE